MKGKGARVEIPPSESVNQQQQQQPLLHSSLTLVTLLQLDPIPRIAPFLSTLSHITYILHRSITSLFLLLFIHSFTIYYTTRTLLVRVWYLVTSESIPVSYSCHNKLTF
jgi:hypothetical protein